MRKLFWKPVRTLQAGTLITAKVPAPRTVPRT